MSVEPLHRLALLHGVWSMGPARKWERIARADSVFDLCRSAPNISGRLLADYPDLLLRMESDGIDAQQIAVLAKGDWITRGHNVIFAGPIGTGKTHLATALGLEA